MAGKTRTPLQKLVLAADQLAYAARTSTLAHQEQEERRFRRLAARLIKNAEERGFDEALDAMSVPDARVTRVRRRAAKGGG